MRLVCGVCGRLRAEGGKEEITGIHFTALLLLFELGLSRSRVHHCGRHYQVHELSETELCVS